MSFKKINPRVNFPELEQKVLTFWRKNKIFEKSISERPKSKQFSFYDGPPYATNTPHFGNILAGIIKDVIPRYKTMQGYRVERVWGWDTHGLPIENIVEEDLGFKSRDEIYEYGVDKFNEKCRSKVFGFVESWKEIIARTGRWADMDNAYITMDKNYMESIWWVFSELWDKDLIYEGYKVMPYCPRCSTGLSSFEVAEGGYKDKKDKAVTIKFELSNEPGTYMLAWTTTPWTLPGNLALTVGAKIDYVKVRSGKDLYILAEARLESYAEELGKYKIVEKMTGTGLVGKKYQPLFEYYENSQTAKDNNSKAFEVISGDFVNTEDGTGVVHTAPAFGEDDSIVGNKFGIDFFMPVDELGRFTDEAPEYMEMSVIDPKTNAIIIKDLGDRVLKVENYNHPYPHCWRCDSPLIYRAIDSWFVNIDKIRNKVLANNKKVGWIPKHVGSGRYAKMVENAPDWNISRNRFWGVPIPVWKCECGEYKVFGNITDLEKASGKKIDDIHLHKIQDLELVCKCGQKSKLTGEILDVWFDAGSMPYGKLHYPFENKEQFEREFPANFIAEGIDQTRGWFRSMMVLGTALFDKSPFENVVVNGTLLTEDGNKMSKSKKNFTDPMILMNQYGADAMRFYLMGSPAVKAEDMRFSEKGVEEVVKKVGTTLWNSYSFFVMYASLDNFVPTGNLDPQSNLDRWLLSITNRLTLDVTTALDKYDLSLSVRLLGEYIDELSNWYIRRSRKRFWKSENDTDKLSAYESLYFALNTYIKLLAPFMPFIADEIYEGLVKSVDTSAVESVHLTSWPVADKKSIDKVLDESMARTREIVTAGLSLRAAAGIKVRQPLASISYSGAVLDDDFKQIICEEVNVKECRLLGEDSSTQSIRLDTDLTPELEAEGIARDFIRFIQDARKKAGFEVENRIETAWNTEDPKISDALDSHKSFIAKETLSVIVTAEKGDSEYSDKIKLAGTMVWFGISRK
jgi:isoleucyl-tRNA synthetase